MPIRSNVSPRLFPTLFFGGRATITLHNQVAETHLTLKVSQVRDRQDRSKRLPIFYLWVSLLDDGKAGKRFAATFFQNTLTYKLGRDVTPDSQLGRVVAWIHQVLKDPSLFNRKRVAVMHEGTCCRCGRKLTHPESIEIGFGPECWETVLSQTETKAEDFFEPLPATFGPNMHIVNRQTSIPFTN